MAEHTSWVLDKKKTALLIVDMQNDFIQEGAVLEVPMARQFLPNMKMIQVACRNHGIPIIYTAHIHYDHFDILPPKISNPKVKQEGLRQHTSGAEIVKELAPRASETVIYKHRHDAFYNTNLEIVLHHIGGRGVVDSLIIIGTVTNLCCESTARSAFMRDYKVFFVSDANGGHDDKSQEATLHVMDRAYGKVISTQQLIMEIDR